ncbi:MAG: CHAT domain-containing protein [Oscillatoria princeps RMCB-10]|jgi:tetratricopeptide (TPR) repeat protein|nr:CHAT domain-containing protein [Oscillatoria princeps RMCB-10]
MEGQENQDYYQLIYELLASPKERAGEILSNRPELLDTQLVKLMGYLAVKLEIAGDSEPANWLKYLASDLAAIMRGVSPVAQTKKAEADRLLQQGADQYYTSKFREAWQSLQQALTLYREIGDRDGEAASLENLGIAYHSLGRYTLAIDYHRQSLEIEREIGNRREEAASLGSLGNAYYSLGRYTLAIDYHRQSLEMAREIGDRRGEANSLGNLGNAYHSLGQYTLAIDYHRQSLEMAREIGDRRGETNSLGNLGNTYNSLGRYTEAIDSLRQSLEIAREIGDRGGEAYSLGNLGIAYRSLGRYTEAIDYHRQWLEIAREIGDRRQEAYSLGNLGIAYHSPGRYTLAIDYHRQWLEIAREIGDRSGEAASLGSLGIAYYSLGQYTEAIEYHRQSLEIAREIGHRRGEAASLGNLGNAYDSLGRYTEAIEYHRQTLEIAREIGDRSGEAISLGSLGNAYRRLQQIPEAIQMYQSALAICTPTGFPVECVKLGRNLGDTHFEAQQWEQAISAYEKALEAVEQRCEWESSPTGKQKLREEAVDVYQNMVQACINTGNRPKALETVERSKSRNLVELLENQELYPKGASEEDKQTLKQLRNSISAKQQLLEATGGEGGGSRAQVAGASGNPNFEYIEKQRQELENDRRKLDELLNRIKEYDPEFTLTQRVEPITFEDIWRLTDAGTAILDWHIGTSSFQAFTLTRDRIYVEEFTQQEWQELETWKDEYLGDYNPPQEEGELKEDWEKRKQQKLANWINQLEPRLSKLAGILHLDRILDKIPKTCRQLIVIPHRYLHLFPLHALPVNRGESSPVSYLLDRFPDGVRYAPSCGLLQRVQARSEARSATVPAIPNTRRLFAIQNPTDDLLYSDSEVQKIETLFNPHTDILRKAAATKDALTKKLPALSRAGCAHFACHGLFNFEFPLISSLILAGAVESSSPHPPTPSAKDGEGEKDTKKASRCLTLRDGSTANPEKCLTLLDVFTDVDLPQCRLVTLSACETGLTQTAQVIDEPIGLSTGFLYAGAVSVVCSLWRVSDLSTALLMVKFYEIRNSEPSVARALNQAQIWLRTVTKANFILWMQSQNLDPDDAGAVEDWLELFNSEEPPFSNPTHWAVFCAIGQ